MYRIESQAKHAGISWGLALAWSLIWFVSGSEDAGRPIIFSFFLVISWLLVFQAYSAKAILRILDRSRSANTSGKDTEVYPVDGGQ